jgi:TRAP-type mannitol/chloroaromatic compound transport system substrate-binding protein
MASRRDFLIGAATGAVVAGGATYLATAQKPEPMVAGTPEQPGQAPAATSGTVEWKMVTTWPKNFPGLGTGAQRVADRISAMSNGKMAVRLYAAGELVPAFEAFDAVREGTAEMSHDASYYWVAKHKSTPFFCTVPGGLTQQEHSGWIHHGGGQALWDELYAEFGLKAFLAGGSGVQMGGWFQKEINSLADLDGLKMRIPGLGAEVVNRMGVTAVNMPGGEIMPALQSGVIDATEWVGPWNDLAFGFHKIAKFYYGPGFHEPSSSLEVMLSKDKFDALPSDLKAIVEAACTAEANYTVSEFTAGNNISQTTLVEEHGVTIGNFPDDVVKTAFANAIDVVQETASEGDVAKRIFDSWWSFRTDAVKRAPYAEQGYMNNRALG